MKNKNFVLFILLLFVLITHSNKVNALTFSSSYTDVTPTSSQANNLINYAMSYDSFIHSDYIIFCDQQYSYYIVWSDDLKLQNGLVTGSNIEYIRYYRSSSTSYDYVYTYGTDSTFSLTSSNVNTSSLEEYGFKSVLYSEYKYYDYNLQFLIIIVAIIFVIMIKSLRRV